MNTPNYNLYLTEDSSDEKFIEWRKKINGEGDSSNESNMEIIDRVLGEKADNSTSVETYLRAISWAGTNAPYLYQLSVSGLGPDQNGFIALSKSATDEQRQAAADALLIVGGQAADTLTVLCKGEKPAIDIPVCVVLIG